MHTRIFAAVALALAAAPFGQGADLVQLANTQEGTDVAVFEQGGKSFMVAYSLTGDAEVEASELTASLLGEPVGVIGYAPIPADRKPVDSAMVEKLAQAEKALTDERAARIAMEKALVGRSTAYAGTLGKLAVALGRLTPPMRDEQVNGVTKAFGESTEKGEAALKQLETRVASGAFVIPGKAKDLTPPGSDADSSKPAGGTTGAGPMTLEAFQKLNWTEKGQLMKTDPEGYEALMAQMPGADLRKIAKDARAQQGV